MAMLPFIGYNAGDYFNHWITVGKDNDAAKLPKIFYVNWFRRDDDGGFLWPGFGENSRVLKWVVERIEGQAAAVETPIGHVPTPGSLDIDGLDMTDGASSRPGARRRRRGVEGRDPADHRVVREVRRRPPGRALDRARRPQGPPRRLSPRTARPTQAPSGRRTGPCVGVGLRHAATMRSRGHDGKGTGDRAATAPRTGSSSRPRRRRSTRRPSRSGGLAAPTTRGSPRTASCSRRSTCCVDLGLLRHDDGDRPAASPVDPAAVQSQVVVPLGQQGAELLTESARWADAFGELGQTSAGRSPQAAVSPFTEIHGLDEHQQLHPRRGQRLPSRSCSPPSRTAGAPATTLARGRGPRHQARSSAASRCARSTSTRARHSPATRDYVADIVARGAEVRTLDEFFNRLIVVDRQARDHPGPGRQPTSRSRSTSTSLVAYLVDIFERSWERARPFTISGDQVERDIAADVRAMTIRMLVEGHSDPASAKRLGVSTRTYAGYIAALKDEYGVQTRFQLGYAMGADARPASRLDGTFDDDGRRRASTTV